MAAAALIFTEPLLPETVRHHRRGFTVSRLLLVVLGGCGGRSLPPPPRLTGSGRGG